MQHTAHSTQHTAKAYYPIFADLTGRRCLVVGGGLVAQRKVTTLLGFGARVTVVSPTLTRRLAALARQGRIRSVPRRAKSCDVEGQWLVYAATDDPLVNRLVSQAAQRRNIFVNVVDQTPLCSFVAPAILRRGALTIGISTSGGSPSLAKRLRAELGAHIGPEYASMLRLLSGLRGVAKQRLPHARDRKQYFDRLVHGRVFRLVRRGRFGLARKTALALLAQRSPVVADH